MISSLPLQHGHLQMKSPLVPSYYWNSVIFLIHSLQTWPSKLPSSV